MDASSSISVFILLDFNQFKYVGNFLLLYLIFLRNYSTSLIAYRIGDSYNCMILFFFSMDFFFFFQLEDLQRLCKLGSRTPGHPENVVTDGIEVTTGTKSNA